MDVSSSVLILFSIINSLLLISLGIYVFSNARHDSRGTINQLKNKIEENKAALKTSGDELARRIEAIEDSIKLFQEQNIKNSSIFKTVLYGCDMIVQGCKNALQIDNFQEIESKLASDLNLLEPGKNESASSLEEEKTEAAEANPHKENGGEVNA